MRVMVWANRRNLSPETITRFLQEIIKFCCWYLTSIAVSSILLFPSWCCGNKDMQYSLLDTALGCAPLVNLQHAKSTSESSQHISSMDQIIQWLFCSSNYRGLPNPGHHGEANPHTSQTQPLNQTHPFCSWDPIWPSYTMQCSWLLSAAQKAL